MKSGFSIFDIFCLLLLAAHMIPLGELNAQNFNDEEAIDTILVTFDKKVKIDSIDISGYVQIKGSLSEDGIKSNLWVRESGDSDSDCLITVRRKGEIFLMNLKDISLLSCHKVDLAFSRFRRWS